MADQVVEVELALDPCWHWPTPGSNPLARWSGVIEVARCGATFRRADQMSKERCCPACDALYQDFMARAGSDG